MQAVIIIFVSIAALAVGLTMKAARYIESDIDPVARKLLVVSTFLIITSVLHILAIFMNVFA